MAALLVRVRERRTRPMRLTRFDTQASTTSRRKGWRSAEHSNEGAPILAHCAAKAPAAGWAFTVH